MCEHARVLTRGARRATRPCSTSTVTPRRTKFHVLGPQQAGVGARRLHRPPAGAVVERGPRAFPYPARARAPAGAAGGGARARVRPRPTPLFALGLCARALASSKNPGIEQNQLGSFPRSPSPRSPPPRKVSSTPARRKRSKPRERRQQGVVELNVNSQDLSVRRTLQRTTPVIQLKQPFSQDAAPPARRFVERGLHAARLPVPCGPQRAAAL